MAVRDLIILWILVLIPSQPVQKIPKRMNQGFFAIIKEACPLNLRNQKSVSRVIEALRFTGNVFCLSMRVYVGQREAFESDNVALCRITS